MKIKIGENEYEGPISHTLATDAFIPVDVNGKVVNIRDNKLALNELAQLRQERDSLQKRVDELEKALDIANNQERCGQ